MKLKAFSPYGCGPGDRSEGWGGTCLAQAAFGCPAGARTPKVCPVVGYHHDSDHQYNPNHQIIMLIIIIIIGVQCMWRSCYGDKWPFSVCGCCLFSEQTIFFRRKCTNVYKSKQVSFQQSTKIIFPTILIFVGPVSYSDIEWPESYRSTADCLGMALARIGNQEGVSCIWFWLSLW